MKVLAIARTNLVRMLRDTTALVPMLVVPVLFVYIIGVQFGGGQQATIGVVGSGPVADGVVDTLRAGDTVEVSRLGDADELRTAIDAGDLDLGAVVADDATDVLDAGERLAVELVIGDEGTGASLRPLVAQALDEQALAPGVTADLVTRDGAPPAREVRATVAELTSELDRTSVAVVDSAGEEIGAGGGRFAEGAASQLVLMVFLFTLLSAIPLVQSRQLGLSRRMLATPTPVSAIVVGEAAGRWLVALVQGAWILVATVVFFDVGWGNLPTAIAVLVVFGAVGAGAGMLLGSFFDDESVVIGAALLLGLALAALGGAMVPADVFSPTLQSISRATPHAWALDAFATVRDGGSIGDIGTELAVLTAAATVLVATASWRLRVVLTRA
ncbi:hypothetical protein BH23ACT2_BH23ACT2_09060 [soil metagenome]